jgi:predicted amidohydrolase
MKSIRIGVIQPEITPDNSHNYIIIEELIRRAVENHPQILVLPERWHFVDPLHKPFDVNLQPKRGPQYLKVKEWAAKFGVRIISGAIWEHDPRFNRPVISTYFFDPTGRECFEQQKIHLYSVERDVFAPGTDVVIYHDSELDLNLSVLICFDLHISNDLAGEAVEHGTEIILSPTLIRDTGIYNWGIYTQARALENRIPIVSCNSIFTYLDRRFTGQSKIIQFKRGETSPAQLDITELSDRAEYRVVDVDLTFPNRIRKKRDEEKIDPATITFRRL